MKGRRSGRSHALRLFLLACLLMSAALPAMGGGVAILNTVLADNGDDDGFADTGETVTMRLNVQNTSGEPLFGVSATIDTRDVLLACPTQPTIYIGDLAEGEIKLTDEAFEFVVSDVDRTAMGLSAFDDLSVTFDLSLDADPPQEAHPSQITLDLDLDVTSSETPETYFESFEGTLGTFEPQNLDASLHGVEVGDGTRCHYHDPDTAQFPDYEGICFPGVTQLHADAVWWGLSGPGISLFDDGRGFTGQHSLYWGVDQGAPDGFSYPLAVLEAARTTAPIALGIDVSPTLSFKHQIDIWTRCSLHEAYDRAVVMVQVADDEGDPVGRWIKIHPYWNPYESPVFWPVISCSFDPIDDGSTEDDFFEPWDPERRFGPSSTCYPEMVYAEQGYTWGSFAPENVRHADGPGLEGEWGEGTWIESRFDLSRFKGRRIRLRFLATSSKSDNPAHEIYDDVYDDNGNWEDGWWIDDVTIEGALQIPATVVSDSKDNSALPALPDGDLDGVVDLCDNCLDVPNTDQDNFDYDDHGNICDPCVFDPLNDIEEDGHCADVDNCPDDWNPDQADGDGDTFGDVCDTCPEIADPYQMDGDEDGWGAFCDCDDGDSTTYPGAPETNDGQDNQCFGDDGFGLVDEVSGLIGFYNPADKNELSWPAQAGAELYQIVRASTADFSSGCTWWPPTADTFVVDSEVPSPGAYCYLVRARTPNTGSWGAGDGTERVLTCQ